MKKNLAFLMVCLLTVSAGRSLATDMTETNNTQETAAPRNTCPHSFVITPTPGGASITITDPWPDKACYPISYTYDVWAYGLIMNSGSGSTGMPGFNIETTYASSYRLEIHGTCSKGAHFFQIFQVGENPSKCGLEFTEMSLSSAGGYATLIFTPSSTKMNPCGYAIYQNGIKQSEGQINPNGGTVRIPFGTTTSGIEVRIYGDKCMCPNRSEHYYSQTF